MAQKTVAQKLFIKPGSRLWVSSPDGLERLGSLPEDVRMAASLADAATAVLFVADATALAQAVATHGRDLHRPDVLWVAYPKGGRADIDRDSVWPDLAGIGLRPIGQVAIDETWSALRFRPLAPGEAQFRGR